MNILIIGANGFLGREIYKYLSTFNFNIFCMSHQESKEKNFFTFSLYTEPYKDILEINFEAIIYLVHIYDDQQSDKLIEWYKKTFFLFSKKTKKQIYISSCSANINATSNYGRIKYKIENFFLRNNAYSISPGLIIGDGGMYGKIEKLVLIFPIIPIPSSNKENILPIINVQDVYFFIKTMIDNDMDSKNYNIFNDMISLIDLARNIASKNNKKRIIFNISANFTLKIMQIVESIGISLPVSSDSLIGFITNQSYHIKSDI